MKRGEHMGVRIEYQASPIEMPLFRQKYQDRENFMNYCRECPHYGRLWSCPPLPFDADAFLAPYPWANLLCVQIHLDEETIRAADTAEKIKETGWEIVSQAKRETEEKMRVLEAMVPGSVSLSSGGCGLCEGCARKEGLPCRKPEEMCYSMDAFGLDLTAVTKDIFHIEILWCRDSLPKYFTLIHALLTKERMPEPLWEQAGILTRRRKTNGCV